MVNRDDNLNRRAESVFDAIKQRKGWTMKAIQEAAKEDTSVDVNKIQKVLNNTGKRVEVQDPVHHFDEKFDSAKVSPLAFIDSLELPPNLSIAIAAIIEYKEKGNTKSLVNAQEYIEKELRQ